MSALCWNFLQDSFHNKKKSKSNYTRRWELESWTCTVDAISPRTPSR